MPLASGAGEPTPPSQARQLHPPAGAQVPSDTGRAPDAGGYLGKVSVYASSIPIPRLRYMVLDTVRKNKTEEGLQTNRQTSGVIQHSYSYDPEKGLQKTNIKFNDRE